jgi:predicted N-acetyltransferase YhbS
LIDKIRLRIEGAKVNTAYIQDWWQQDTRTGTGHLGNIKIHQNINGVTVTGSIAKYLNGENMTPLSRKGVEAAVKKLEADIGLGLGAAVVTQIEISKTCIVKQCPSEYMRLFGDPPRYGRHEYRCGGMIESVEYSTHQGSYALCVYDKAAEMKRNGAEIPENFKTGNSLRVEYRIERRQGIKARFGHDLTASDLYEYETYRKLQRLFLENYKAIPKIGRVVFVDRAGRITPAELEKREAAAFREMNPDTHRAVIQTLREDGALDAKTMERIKGMERRGRDYALSDASPLIDELDSILESAVKSVA